MAGIPHIPNALAPVVPGQGQVTPPGMMHPGFLGGPTSAPGGANTGIVPPGMMHTMGNAQQIMGQIGDYRNALMDWRGQRPDHQGFDGTPQDWRSQMMDWRQQRPDLFGYLHMGGPVMTPGGGGTGAPLQGNPGQQVGIVPVGPGSMGTNPAPQPLPPVYQFPTY